MFLFFAVRLVAYTNISARAKEGSQFLAYSMTYVASCGLAMARPLPVPPSSGEDAVLIINLEA